MAQGPAKTSMRRPIASIVILIGAVWIGMRFFSAAGKQVAVTLVYRVPADVTRVEATLRGATGDEPLARFVGTPSGGEARQRTKVPPGDCRVTVELDGATRRVVERRVVVSDEATITIDLP